MGKLIYWIPRILSIISTVFLFLFSFDVLGQGYGFWGTALAFFMHNIPVIILGIVTWFAWNHEIVGAVAFIIAGLIYIGLLAYNAITSGFQWYYIGWAIQISGIAFLIGILYLIGWKRRKAVPKKKGQR